MTGENFQDYSSIQDLEADCIKSQPQNAHSAANIIYRIYSSE